MQANTGMNQSGSTYVAYCWAGVDGYSKFGTYEGNGSTDGTYVYLGFQPAFVMIKNIDATEDWKISDFKRSPYNPVLTLSNLNANTDAAQDTPSNPLDYTSNGFKLRMSNAPWNASNTYVYAAFAENPFGGSGIAQAKAR